MKYDVTQQKNQTNQQTVHFFIDFVETAEYEQTHLLLNNGREKEWQQTIIG